MKILLIGATLALSACSAFHYEPVQPWERKYLALPAMTFGAEPLDDMLHDKTFTSKETARGGTGVGGGGCGCN